MHEMFQHRTGKSQRSYRRKIFFLVPFRVRLTAALGLILLLEPDVRTLVTVIPKNSSSPSTTQSFLETQRHFILSLSIIALICYSPGPTSSRVPLPKIHLCALPTVFLSQPKTLTIHTPFSDPRPRGRTLSSTKRAPSSLSFYLSHNRPFDSNLGIYYETLKMKSLSITYLGLSLSNS